MSPVILFLNKSPLFKLYVIINHLVVIGYIYYTIEVLFLFNDGKLFLTILQGSS